MLQSLGGKKNTELTKRTWPKHAEMYGTLYFFKKKIGGGHTVTENLSENQISIVFYLMPPWSFVIQG